MRIAVVGAGGVGGGFGAALAKAGADVTFIARGAHLAAMKSDGPESRRARAATPIWCRRRRPTIPPRSAWSISCCSASSCGTSKAPAQRIKPLVGPGTAVIPLQNGIDAAERLTPDPRRQKP